MICLDLRGMDFGLGDKNVEFLNVLIKKLGKLKIRPQIQHEGAVL
jgi:hypothetical protein